MTMVATNDPTAAVAVAERSQLLCVNVLIMPPDQKELQEEATHTWSCVPIQVCPLSHFLRPQPTQHVTTF